MTNDANQPRFVMIDRGLWDRVSCANDLAKMTAFLVMATGTAVDCCTTKWSTRAIETYAGQRKELSKAKIAEMIAAGIMARHGGTDARPVYRFSIFEREGAIILPWQLITGFAGEVPMLRRVRERRDPVLLRMLIELYAQVDGDQPGFVSPSFIVARHHELGSDIAAKPDDPNIDGEVARWRLFLPTDGRVWVYRAGWPEWMSGDGWMERLSMLFDLGALIRQPWLLNGSGDDADYVSPLSTEVENGPCVDIRSAIEDAREALCDHLRGDNIPHDGRWDGAIPVPLRIAQPNVEWFYRLRVEPDTWSMRAAYGRRMEMIADFADEMEAARRWATEGSAQVVRLNRKAGK